MSDYRTTAYCRSGDHGLQVIVTVTSRQTVKHGDGGIHLAGALACGCSYSCVASPENVSVIAAVVRG
jgi:hypothetical protein